MWIAESIENRRNTSSCVKYGMSAQGKFPAWGCTAVVGVVVVVVAVLTLTHRHNSSPWSQGRLQ